MAEPKIIILTPVRDEAWILERFLLAASAVADHVLVLDQKSEDASREICGRFPKVTVMENPGADYNETSRSQLLVAAARERFGPGNVLIALDADEILTGDSIQSREWAALRSLPRGTVICFEKPEMLPQPPRCVRSDYWFPMGLVDDGSEFKGRLIHSNRIPLAQEAPRFHAAGIVAMHFARLRPMEYAARQAFYCMVECANRTKSHRIRNCYYSPRVFLRFGEGQTEPCPAEWFAWFREQGVDLWSYHTERFNTFHKRALRLFAQHGPARFQWEDIWWEDWEGARRFFTARGEPGLPAAELSPPLAPVRAATRSLLSLYLALTAVANTGRRLFGTSARPRMDI